MKTLKKAIAVFVGIALVLTLSFAVLVRVNAAYTATGGAPAGSNHKVYVKNYRGNGNGDVSVWLDVQSASEVEALTFTITYDPVILTADTGSIVFPMMSSHGWDGTTNRLVSDVGGVMKFETKRGLANGVTASGANVELLRIPFTTVGAANSTSALGVGVNSLFEFSGGDFIESSAITTGDGVFTVASILNLVLKDTSAPIFTGSLALGAVSWTNNSVDLTWPMAVDDRTSASGMKYRIYDQSGLVATAAGVTGATVSHLAANTYYEFAVTATDETGNLNLGGSVAKATGYTTLKRNVAMRFVNSTATGSQADTVSTTISLANPSNLDISRAKFKILYDVGALSGVSIVRGGDFPTMGTGEFASGAVWIDVSGGSSTGSSVDVATISWDVSTGATLKSKISVAGWTTESEVYAISLNGSTSAVLFSPLHRKYSFALNAAVQNVVPTWGNGTMTDDTITRASPPLAAGSVSANTNNSIRLNWNIPNDADSAGEVEYERFIKTEDGSVFGADDVPESVGTGVSHVFAGLRPGRTYRVMVKALDADGGVASMTEQVFATAKRGDIFASTDGAGVSDSGAANDHDGVIDAMDAFRLFKSLQNGFDLSGVFADVTTSGEDDVEDVSALDGVVDMADARRLYLYATESDVYPLPID